jgi:hypothetical protein
MMTACWVLVGQEVVLGHPFHEAARIGCGLLNVVEVIGQAVLAHIGCASASTLAELRRQVAGSQQIDVNAEQRFQFFFQIAQVQQRGTGQRIDQQVEVAAIPVGAMQHRAEDARVRGAKAAYRFTLRFASCQAQQTVACASFLIETR